jgi:hypothetical protein
MYRMLHYMSKKYLNLGNGLSSVVVECLQKYWSEWEAKFGYSSNASYALY